MRIGKVGLDPLNGKRREPSTIFSRWTDGAENLMALLKQKLYGVTSDESGSTGNEYPRDRKFLSLSVD